MSWMATTSSTGVVFGERETLHDRRDLSLARRARAPAVNRCNGVKVSLTHDLSHDRRSCLEVRAFNDGVAYRHVVPGAADAVARAGRVFDIHPAGRATVWYHDLDGHYEAAYVRKDIAEVRAGQWAGPPLTFQLPQGAGYGVDHRSEPGQLQRHGAGSRRPARLGRRASAIGSRSTIRSSCATAAKKAKRLGKAAAISGTITTPWRVVMVGRDLNTLVNSDDPAEPLSARRSRALPTGHKTPWVRAGHARSGATSTGGPTRAFERMKDFSPLARPARRRVPHHRGLWPTVDAGRADREFVELLAKAGVGVVVLAAHAISSARRRRGTTSSRMLRASGWRAPRSISSITKPRRASISTRSCCARPPSTSSCSTSTAQQADRPAAHLAERARARRRSAAWSRAA